MRTPNIYWITQLQNFNVQIKHPTVGWTAARPLGLMGIFLRRRIGAAWLVFTGKADAVKWYDISE